MIRTILESTDHAEKVAKTFGASKWLSHTLKMRFAEKVLFFRTPWLKVFGRCDLISRLSDMLRTILRSADYLIQRSVAIDFLRWLRILNNAVC